MYTLLDSFRSGWKKKPFFMVMIALYLPLLITLKGIVTDFCTLKYYFSISNTPSSSSLLLIYYCSLTTSYIVIASLGNRRIGRGSDKPALPPRPQG